MVHFFFSLAGPRDKQVVFAIRAELGLTPQMDVGPYAYARCGGFEKALDFTGAGHGIVKSTLLLSFDCSTEGMWAYRRGSLWSNPR